MRVQVRGSFPIVCLFSETARYQEPALDHRLANVFLCGGEVRRALAKKTPPAVMSGVQPALLLRVKSGLVR